MKSFVLTGLACVVFITQAHALVINEIVSNPTGEDSGREWVELYNDGTEDIDLSSLVISIKGGNPIVITPMQGGTSLPGGGYAVIASTVSGQTKFLQDYSSYSGILFRSSISLVNTGVTSIEIKNNGSTAAGPLSYTAAKEGNSLSFVSGEYVAGTPTPGAQNTALESSQDTVDSSSTVTTPSQVTIPQLSPASPDITIYFSEEKTVVAGAESEYSVFSLTRSGKVINDLRYVWAFGDGGQAVGSSTRYTYAYTGRYIAQVEANNASIFGTARMTVRVVAPDIEITTIGSDKHGSYIDIHNPNPYPLDLSQWGFSIDGAVFPFPKNTMILPQETTRFSGKAMGFASTTLASSTLIRILFPNNEEVTKYVPQEKDLVKVVVPVTAHLPLNQAVLPKKLVTKKSSKVLGVSTSTTESSSSQTLNKVSTNSVKPKDTRIVSWFRSFFKNP